MLVDKCQSNMEPPEGSMPGGYSTGLCSRSDLRQ